MAQVNLYKPTDTKLLDPRDSLSKAVSRLLTGRYACFISKRRKEVGTPTGIEIGKRAAEHAWRSCNLVCPGMNDCCMGTRLAATIRLREAISKWAWLSELVCEIYFRKCFTMTNPQKICI